MSIGKLCIRVFVVVVVVVVQCIMFYVFILLVVLNCKFMHWMMFFKVVIFMLGCFAYCFMVNGALLVLFDLK